MNTTTASADTAAPVLSAMIGESLAVLHLRRLLVRYAPLTAPVLILGESGSGKELVASAIHACSPRARRPYVAFNAATLSHGTGQSELFGHARGAFTGATHSHRGLFEQAQTGTLFLDEIGDLSPEGQGQLLRVLEYGEIRAVGAEHAHRVDVRVVCATHRDLGQLVAEKQFRADLAYRLGVLVLRVPPLRDRVDDIPLLAQHLLTRHASDLGPKSLARNAIDALSGYHWPGNVRQLGAVLLRAAVNTDGVVIGRDVVDASLDEERRMDPATYGDGGMRRTRGMNSAGEVRLALAASGGQIKPAARMLGVARSTLRAQVERFGIARSLRETG